MTKLRNFFAPSIARISRIRQMSWETICQKLHQRLRSACSYRRWLRRIAYSLDRVSIRFFEDNYVEQIASGPVNLDMKMERVAQGGPFEPYEIALINRAAVHLLGEARKILEVGCGTGMFAFEAARDSRRMITASEFDQKTRQWAEQNRRAANIKYCDMELADVSPNTFECVVALEVIEHVTEYGAFLRGLANAAPCALISTPNKNRDAFASIANTPASYGHVREWTAGEFYWVLRSFYDKVSLFTLPDFQRQVQRYKTEPTYKPQLKECSVLERAEPLIAYCRDPLHAMETKKPN